MIPRAYYNENDPFAAHWLYNLIQQNLIAPGDIDTRDIRDVRPVDLKLYAQCHFFAGIGGWSLALRNAGVPDRYPVWTGSCPCQPFSQAGRRRGFADERHLWPAWYWLVSQCRPAVVLGEQVASAADWLRLVRGDLEALDYAVGAMPVEAASAGADHLRNRYWFVAHHAASPEGRRRIQQPGEGAATAAIGASNQFTGSGADDRFVGHAKTFRSRRRTDDENQGWRQYAFADSSERSVVAHGGGARLAFGERNARVQREALGASSRQDVADAGAVGNSDIAGGWIGNQQSSRQQQEQQRDQASRFAWVIGADGKARRVEPGIRLLVDGFPNRVGLLRGFGNAIDPRPAQAFIEAAFGAIRDLLQQPP